jgi:hypothetical protein
VEHVPYYLESFQPLLDAMVRAEGGEDAFLTAIRCSKPQCSSYGEALAIACKTIRNRVLACHDWAIPVYDVVRHKGEDPWTGEDNPRRLVFSDQFIRFLGERWAPVGVDNDPQNLNHHWVPNVTAIYHQLLEESDGDRGIESTGGGGAGGVAGTVLPGSR